MSHCADCGYEIPEAAMGAGPSTWAHGAIGMPSVVKKDAHTLALLYDGVAGSGIGHLQRQIGLAHIALPLHLR